MALSDLVTEEVLLDEEGGNKKDDKGKGKGTNSNSNSTNNTGSNTNSIGGRLVSMEKILGVLRRISVERQGK